MDTKSDSYVTTRTALGAAITLILVIAGWLVTSIVKNLDNLQDVQKAAVQRISTVEAEIKFLSNHVEKADAGFKTRQEKILQRVATLEAETRILDKQVDKLEGTTVKILDKRKN